MKKYESVLLYTERFGQEDLDKSSEKLTKLLEKNGAQNVSVTPWGRRVLAYEIDKNKHAHYQLLHFETDGTACAELERQLRIEPGIIRFQTFVDNGANPTEDVHYRNVDRLARHITDRGKIRPSRSTRMSAKHQRVLSQQIKRARMLGLLPFTTSHS